MASDVAQSVDSGNTGVLVFVDDEVPFWSLLEIIAEGGFEIELFDLGRATDCPEEFVDFDGFAVFARQFEDFVGAFTVGEFLDLFEAWVVLVDDDAVLFVRGCDCVLDHGVEGAEEFVVADVQVRFDANGVHHSGQFDSDVACANDGELLGQFLDLEEAVGGDAVFGAGDVAGQGRMTTDGDRDVRSCTDDLAAAICHINLDFILGQELRGALDEIDTVVAPVALVDSVQSLDLGVAVLLEGRKVEGDVLRDVVTVVDAVFEGFVDV